MNNNSYIIESIILSMAMLLAADSLDFNVTVNVCENATSQNDAKSTEVKKSKL